MVRDEIQIKAELDYAVEQAEAKGKAERNVEIAKALKEKGVEIAIICQATGLSEEQIKAL